VTIVGDTEAALDFLRRWHGESRRIVITIDPVTNKTVRRDFMPAAEVAMRAFVEAAQGVLNVYTPVNHAGLGPTTPTKEQMLAARALHVDADLKDLGCDEETALARLRALDPSPGIIFFSGGGYWALWRLAAPYNGSADWRDRIERANEALHRAVGANPTCRNVNRLMRVPGTVNVLSETKRKAGREPALAHLVAVDADRSVALEDFDVPALNGHDPDGAEHKQSSKPVLELPEKVMKVVTTGEAKRWNGDRSRAVFYVATAAVRAGWPDDAIAELILDPKNGISAHVLEQGRPRDYAARQAASARQKVMEDWERNMAGTVVADSQKNVRRALYEMRVGLRYDEFAMRILVDGGQIDDAIGNQLRFAISDNFDFRPNKEFFFDYLGALAREDSFHPVRDYLGRVAWDGAPRIGGGDTPGWLTTYGKAEDTAFVRAVSRLVLVGAVRRVRQPGCKFDTMLVLVNPEQGTEKSSVVAGLAVRQEWYNGTLQLNMRSREVIEQIAGKWIVELSDLAGWRRAEIEQVKAFLSLQVDRARHAYGHFPGDVPRSCIMIGTTNRIEFLKDTQNRRFWPIRVARFEIANLLADRDQLWAEAAAAEAAGEPITLDAELWDAASKVQETYREVDPWIYVMEEGLAGFTDCRISTAHLFDILKLPNGVKNSSMSSRLADVMRELGWDDNGNKIMRIAGRPCNGWRKGNGEQHLVWAIDQVIDAKELPIWPS
jgi:predicted P-loop ATPase